MRPTSPNRPAEAVEPLVTPGSQGEAIGRLVVAGLVVTMLPALPFGAYLIYPFAILTTWFHEMGHGLTALATAANLATVAGYLDTEIAAILADTNELQTDWTNGGRLDLLVDAIKAKTDALPAAPAAVSDIPTAGAIADAVHDEVVEGTVTLRQSIRLHNSALGGKVQGLDTFNPVFRDLADSKDVIDATVDSYGNRSAVTRDLS